MVKRKRFGQTKRSEIIHLQRRRLHCENLETRVLPGTFLLSLFGAGAGTGLIGEVAGDANELFDRTDRRSTLSQRESATSSQDLSALLDNLEQASRRRPPYRSNWVGARDSNSNRGERRIDTNGGALGRELRSLLDFQLDVNLDAPLAGSSDSELIDTRAPDLASPPPHDSSGSGGGGGGGGSSSGGGGSGGGRGSIPFAPSNSAASSSVSAPSNSVQARAADSTTRPAEASPPAAPTGQGSTSVGSETQSTSGAGASTTPSASAMASAYLLGDFNQDRSVDSADYTVWRNNRGIVRNASTSQGDGDFDGDVEDADYTVWKSHFGLTALTAAGQAAVQVSVGFPDGLNGWEFGQEGGSASGQGLVEIDTGAAVIHEGDSFLVTLERTFEVPTESSVVSFTFDGPDFDTTSSGTVRDAFEVALLDEHGNSLIHTIDPTRDAAFNITQEQPAAFGQNVTLVGNTVTLDLADVFAGTSATLIFRWVNNDGDAQSSVRITDVQVPSIGILPVRSVDNRSWGYSERGLWQNGTSGGWQGNHRVLPAGSTTGSASWVTILPTADYEIFATWTPSATSASNAVYQVYDGATLVGTVTRNQQVAPTLGEFDNQLWSSLGTFAISSGVPTVKLLGNSSGNVDADGVLFAAPRAKTPALDREIAAATRQSTNSIDFNSLVDVSQTIRTENTQTSFRENGSKLFADVRLHNGGTYGVGGPLVVVIDSVSNPKARPIDFDGLTPDGRPYYDFSNLLTDSELAAGEAVGVRSLSFLNPDRTPFTFDLRMLGQLNRAPVFTSEPDTETLINKPYSFAAQATDPDGDQLTFSAPVRPAGLTIDADTGVVMWQATAADVGTHAVTLRVADGRGGTDERSFTIDVLANVPNRPPLFTSFPVVGASADTPYQYDADALDPDGDALSYALATVTTAIPVVNHSFEAQILSEDVFTIGALTGWTFTGVGTFAGAWNPGPTRYPDGAAADGQNIAYSNDPAITQVLSEPLRPHTRYALTVAVGDRLDNGLTGFSVQLRAGGQVLASTSSPLPADGTFVDAAVNFDSPIEHPMLGQPLEIRLSGGIGVNWDNVRLTATEIFVAPTGMTIDPASGEIAWTPTVDQIGTHEIRVRATDSHGGTADQAYTILIAPDRGNRPPIIISDPTPSVLILPLPANRSNLTIDFEGIPAGPFFQNSPVPPEATLSDRFLTTHGVTFRSQNGVPSIAVVNLGVGHATSGRNGIGGMQSATVLDYATPIVAEFFVPSDPGIPALTDFVSIKVDRQGAFGTVVMEAFGLDGELLASTSDVDDGLAMLTLSAPGIHKVVIRGVSNTAFDDFSFNEVYSAQIYEYDVRVIDPDNDALVFSLTTAPAGMTIGPTTGKIRWPVASLNAGMPLVTVRVTDGRHGFDSQSFVVEPTIASAKISGTKFDDLNGNGLRDGREPGLDGWTVYLDQDRNYRRGPGESFAITDANGDYAFNNLAPDTYIVREEPQPGWHSTPPTGGVHAVTLANGEILMGQDFGNTVSDVRNVDPIFNTTPVATTSVGQDYRYDAAATDADVDPLFFDLLLGPEGMSVDSETGVVVWSPAADQVRVHDVILRVSDGRGGVALQPYSVTAAAAQTAPVFTTPPPQFPAIVDHAYKYQFRAQDADDDPLVFSLDQTAAGIFMDPVSGLLSWTPEFGQLGVHTIIVSVNDGRGGQDSMTFPLEVVAAAPNIRPVITSTPRTHIHLGGRYLYAVEVFDENNDANTLVQPAAPAGMVLDPATGLAEWFPSPDQLGDNMVEIRADDGHGGVAVQSFVIRVATTVSNEPPRIISTPVVAVTLEEQYAYGLRANDPDGDPLIWNLTTAPRGMSIDARLGTIRWTPAADQLGPAEVAVLVTDAQGGRATQSFTINVQAMNVPPIISSVPPTQARAGLIYNYAVRAVDADGDTPSYSFVRSPAGMSINSVTGLVEWTPTEGQIGSQDVILLVEDGRGGIATQTYTIDVALVPINLPPTIVTTPTVVASVGRAYSYDADAQDPEGNSLTFELRTAPAGMTINSTTGAIDWTPDASQIGIQSVTLAARDTAGHAAFQSFLLSVRPANRPPVIVSAPANLATPGEDYRYDVIASDPDGDRLTYQLTSGPAGMTTDALGRITWPATITDIGTYPVTVVVTDPFGVSTSQSFDLVVSGDDQPPIVDVELNESSASLGSLVTIRVSANDNVGVAELELSVGGTALALDPSGRAEFNADQVGTFDVVVTATDAAGNFGQNSTALAVIDRSDVNAPAVGITSPSDEAVITQLVDVVGTAADDNLSFYTLDVAVLGSNQFTEIARGTSSIANGVLGTLDPTLLQNDVYVLRLTAVDTGGNSSSVEQIIHVEGDLKLGNFMLSYSDLTVPVLGVPITVARTYDTLNAHQAAELGFGWRLEFRDTNLRTSVAPTGLEDVGIFNPFDIRTRVYVTLPGGKRESFMFRPELADGFRGTFLGIFEPQFEPGDGVTSSLTVVPADLRVSAAGEIFDYATGTAYNPTSPLFGGTFVLTTKDGIAYRVDGRTGQLTTLSDTNDNILRFSDSGITGPGGVSVSFERDPQGRIISVVDPAGQRIRYQYDARGDLVAVTDRENNTTQFVYHESPKHYLEKVIDPLGRTGIRTEYDAQGRLSSIVDAAGNPVHFAFDPSNQVATVTDALGHQTTEEYDARGNTLTRIDALGAVTRRTFDIDNNKLTETDALGRTTTFTYNDRGDILTETNPLGETTNSTYEAFTYGVTAEAAVEGRAALPFTRVKSSTDPLGNTTRTSYDRRGNLIAQIDPLGNTTTTVYDSAGYPILFTDALGNTTRNAYDGRGNRTQLVDPNGHVLNYSYDANGNPLSQTELDGGGWSMSYNAEGLPTGIGLIGLPRSVQYDALNQATQFTDPAGQTATLAYDVLGNMTQVTLPDGTIAQTNNYDAVGNLVTVTDSLGNVTRYAYDAVDQLIQTTYADGSIEKRAYNLAGEFTKLTDPLGNDTRYVYDGAGREIQIIDAQSGITSTEYDSAGRVVATIDPLGHATRFEYDANGEKVAIVAADGSTMRNIYSANGELLQFIDAAGHITNNAYDRSGNLSSVTDDLGNVTLYEYGDENERVSIVDAKGHTTRFRYDAQGHIVETTQPNGDKETATYDFAGRLESTTDGNGKTTRYDYDVRGRLTTRTLPDNSQEVYTYTSDGLVSSFTDARGTRRYDYDPFMRRLVRVTEPDGAQVSYGYDAAGNRISLTATVGANSLLTNFTYDTLNRLRTVTDSDLGITRYTYDAAGNLIKTELPNSIVERRSYDDLNRLLNLENLGTSGVVSSQRYTLTPTGHRSSMVEADGRRVDYSYDALDRLTREQITDAVFGDRTVVYTYDAVGNRQTRNDSTEGLTEYTYDVNDRLLTETLDGGVTESAYDKNGNLLSRTSATDRAFYNWDFKNSLISADTDGDGTIDVQNQYDENGIRVSQMVAGQETRFLIDPLEEFAQVALDYRPSGLIVATYVYGHDLISQNRDGARLYYQVDGLGSTRALTDSAGAVVKRYQYDAFGRTLNLSGAATNPYQFAGQQRDLALGLDYLRARYYDPATGRFVSRDAFPASDTLPLSLNRYLYSLANPVNYSDPSGNFTLLELSTAAIAQLEIRAPQLVRAADSVDKATKTFFKILQRTGGILTMFTVLEALGEPEQVGGYFGSRGKAKIFSVALGIRAEATLAKVAFTMTTKRVAYDFNPSLPATRFAETYPLGNPNTVYIGPAFASLPLMPTQSMGRFMVGTLIHEFSHLVSRGKIMDFAYRIPSLRLLPWQAIYNADNYRLAVQGTYLGISATEALRRPG